MKNIYWVGNRASDIAFIKNEFDGYVCLYGEHDGITRFSNIPIRKNNDVNDKSSDIFFENSISKICQHNSKAMFVFYNPMLAYRLNSKYKNRFLFLNKSSILNLFDDKIQCHSILSKYVNFCPFVTLFGSEINYNNLKKIFPNSTKFVLQESKSAAGLGTFIVDKNNISYLIKNYINSKNIYLVSEYQNNSKTINFHVVFDNESSIIFPPSYCIMTHQNAKMNYVGSSFIDTEQFISAKEIIIAKEMIDSTIKFLRQFGYKGILGFDFLQTEKNLFFLELNLRYQGSSNILNKMLVDANLPNLITLNYMAFQNNLPSIDFSQIQTFYANTFSYYQIQEPDILPYKIYATFDDGLQQYSTFEKGTYLKRIIYKK